jgi:hypothetical protein
MDDFGLLVGRYLSSLPSLTTTQLSELMLDVNGRLIISGRYLEDAAHSSGDAGLFVMGVRNDTPSVLTSNDGDYSPISVDQYGRVRVLADLDVTFDYVYEEDAAASSGDEGAFVLAVRQDALSSSTSTDGDYAAFKVNAVGELYVHDTDANSSLSSIVTSTGNIDTSTSGINTKLGNLSKAEDSAHSSGDDGIMPLAVRHDAESSLVSTDGDYAPLQVNAVGRLKVSASVEDSSTEQYTVTDALAAAGDGLEVITAAATPWITVASFALSTGTAYLYGWQWACDQNADARIVTDDTTDIIVYKRALNSSAMPSYAEHFADNGKIEIPGAASLVIKLQIKKRSATGGNANGTGSLHIRKI